MTNYTLPFPFLISAFNSQVNVVRTRTLGIARPLTNDATSEQTNHHALPHNGGGRPSALRVGGAKVSGSCSERRVHHLNDTISKLASGGP